MSLNEETKSNQTRPVAEVQLNCGTSATRDRHDQ